MYYNEGEWKNSLLTSWTFPSLSINFIIGSRPLTYLIWRLGNFAGRSLLTNAEKKILDIALKPLKNLYLTHSQINISFIRNWNHNMLIEDLLLFTTIFRSTSNKQKKSLSWPCASNVFWGYMLSSYPPSSSTSWRKKG